MEGSRRAKEEMPGTQVQRGEVARLLSQISAEYEAAKLGVSGLSYGTARHAFITARMEKIGSLHHQLQALVGDEAIGMMAARLDEERPLCGQEIQREKKGLFSIRAF